MNDTKMPGSLREPVVLSLPRLSSDTRLRVFDQDFLMQSAVLKLHSEFFAAFLNDGKRILEPKNGIVI